MGRVPRVSIGIPVYNGERFLEGALNSILGQTYRDFEVVICDNASTDKTESICREYMRKDSRIQYFRNEENLGAAFNYNRVFELSRGQYFKWAAVDDVIAPDMLRKCVEILDKDPSVILCYPQTTIIDGDGKVLTEYEDGLNLPSDSVLSRFRVAVKATRECNAVFGVIRSVVLKGTALIGNYPGSDRALLGELTLYGKFFEIPERLFLRRQHPQASSCNKALVDQQEFFDPKTKGNVFMFVWRHLWENFVAVWRMPVPFHKKISLYLFLVTQGIISIRALVREVKASLIQIGKNISARAFKKRGNSPIHPHRVR
jgi:glycosyltransferase involved in cell wall biosynthesis